MYKLSDLAGRIFGSKKLRRYSYSIGSKTYIQKPLVLGQIRQLLDLLRGIAIPAGCGAAGLIFLLGDKVPSALAIILTEEGKTPQDKDLLALAAGYEFTVTPEMILEILDDFLACNPLASLLQRLAGMMEKIDGLMAPAMPPGSPNSQSLSPTGTSPNATPSSGA